MVFTLQPAKGEDFVNRDALLGEMVSTLKDPNIRMGFALYGKRRVGKTSVFKELQRRLEGDKYVVIAYISVWDLVEDTLDSFVKELTSKTLSAYQTRLGIRYKLKDLLRLPADLLRKAIMELKISAKVQDSVEFLLTFDQGQKDYDDIIDAAFALPEALAKETKTRCVLLIDEFPSLVDLKKGNAGVGEGILKKIRTRYEDMENTVFCISGSVRKTMEVAAISAASPFYRQLIVKEVEPLTKEYVKALLTKNLGQKVTEDVAESVWGFSKGIPFYVQFIGREIRTMDMVRSSDVADAIEQFLAEEGDVLYKEEFRRLSSKERAIIVSIANGRYSPTDIAKGLRETPNVVGRFLSYLEEKSVVTKTARGTYEFEDVIFGRWVQRKYT